VPPTLHDLVSLRDLLSETSPLPVTLPDLDRLTDRQVEARYHGRWAAPTTADAPQAATIAASVDDYVVDAFARRGVAVG